MNLRRPDPVFRNARREAGVVLVVWGLSLLWTVGYCGLTGYGNADEVKIVLGLPDWVFTGVAVPWILATAFTAVFAVRFMEDDELEPEGASDE